MPQINTDDFIDQVHVLLQAVQHLEMSPDQMMERLNNWYSVNTD